MALSFYRDQMRRGVASVSSCRACDAASVCACQPELIPEVLALQLGPGWASPVLSRVTGGPL